MLQILCAKSDGSSFNDISWRHEGGVLRDTGAGSLRAAINSANAAPAGKSTLIKFWVNGTIILYRPLPAIVRRVTIDATSAPTHVSGGPPVVALDFNRHPGLLFAAGSAGSRLLGVAVDDANGNGVTLDAGQVTLDDNYIGLNLAGAAAPNRGNDRRPLLTGWAIAIRGLPPGGPPNILAGNRAVDTPLFACAT
jgi:hypothetical protein